MNESVEKVWFAVQEESSDDWDTGSESLQEAVEMLRDDEALKLIAIVEPDNNFCVGEIGREEAENYTVEKLKTLENCYNKVYRAKLEARAEAENE